jgi:outer membrane protein TolC
MEMNRFGRLAMVSLLLTLGLQAAEVTTLSLEQAFGAVDKVNLNALVSRENAVQAAEAANVQRSQLLPNVAGNLAQKRSEVVTIVGGRAIAGAASNRFDAQLTGSITLLDLAKRASFRAARAGADAAESTYAAVLQDVLAEVAGAFFAHQRNVARLVVLDANIERAKVLLGLARNQLAAGVATQIDVTRAEAQLLQAEQARLQQETTLVRSEFTLKRLLDLNPALPLQLQSFQVRRSDARPLIVGDDRTWWDKRSDYVAAQKLLEQAKLGVSAASMQRAPALAFSGQYGVAAANFDDSGRKDAWSAGVGLTFPIFDGLKIGSDRRAALSRQRAQELRVHNLEVQISADLRVTQQDANSRNAQVAVAEKNLGLSQEELRLAQQRYQRGVADNREVVEAQNRLAIAEDNLVEAVYQYQLSRVEHARVRGDVRSVLAERAP